jgi:nitrate reductase gamma subunit
MNNNFPVDAQGDMTLLVIMVLVGLLVAASIMVIAKARRVIAESGPVPQEEGMSYPMVLGAMLVVAGAITFLLKTGWEANNAMLNTFAFTVFPYLALAIFLIGSVYRYLNRGFQVSSLSSEFLERKKLFWGSQPFHYGILFLFFGHLIAFLFPSSVLAWNGSPVRLLILEMAAFAFGLSVLVGLSLLIKRRLSSSKVLVVTNRMDMLVYTILLVQVISGLTVAFGDRWGSSWFASVLTPYLRSVLAFNPDVAAVSAMPWTVKLHIFSALFIIAVIPFTRFMHFLVAPVDYIWRSYQLVIWNWNRNTIRKSTSWFFGYKAKNH